MSNQLDRNMFPEKILFMWDSSNGRGRWLLLVNWSTRAKFAISQAFDTIAAPLENNDHHVENGRMMKEVKTVNDTGTSLRLASSHGDSGF